jgi:hypothetical protein
MRLRRGREKWNESDWVITDNNGKTLLGLSKEDMYRIVESYRVYNNEDSEGYLKWTST